MVIPRELTLANAGSFLPAAGAGPAAGARIDLAPLERFDSAAVAVLLALRRGSGARPGFVNVPSKLRQLAALYGVDSLLFDAE